MTTIDEIDAKAKAATQGEWQSDMLGPYPCITAQIGKQRQWICGQFDQGSNAEGDAGDGTNNRDHVVACSPATILKMTADLRACAESLRKIAGGKADDGTIMGAFELEDIAEEALQNLQKNWGLNG